MSVFNIQFQYSTCSTNICRISSFIYKKPSRIICLDFWTPCNVCKILESWGICAEGFINGFLKFQVFFTNDFLSNWGYCAKSYNFDTKNNFNWKVFSMYACTTSSIAGGFECGRSRVQSPVKGCVIPKTL